MSETYINSPNFHAGMSYAQIRHIRRTHRRRVNARQRLVDVFTGSSAERIALELMRDEKEPCRPDTSVLTTAIDAVNSIDETFSLSAVNAVNSLIDKLLSFATCIPGSGKMCEYCLEALTLKRARIDKLETIDETFKPYVDAMVSAIQRSRRTERDSRPMPYDCSILDALAIGRAEIERLTNLHDALADQVRDASI
jgi:hypothetical protein